MQKILALFDFDGTITKKDSFLEFIKYYKGVPSFYFGIFLLSPVLLFYKMGIIRNWKAKEIVFTWFFRNEPYKEFRRKSDGFSRKVIPQLVKPGAMEAIKKHAENGDRIIIISASFEEYLTGWCEFMNCELLATRIKIENGHLTGRFDGKNCYGPEKLFRLKQFLDLSLFEEIYVYGDSHGDESLLEIADHRFYKSFQ